MLDKESIYELQKIDCNCNDCKFMVRDIAKLKEWDWWYEGRLNCSYRINYGNCTKLNKPITFIPNNCQMDTQGCFEHRRDKPIEEKKVTTGKEGARQVQIIDSKNKSNPEKWWDYFFGS